MTRGLSAPAAAAALAAVALAAGVGLAAGAAGAQTVDRTPNDYGRDEAWLCRPGRSDACAIDLAATVVRADGSYGLEPFRPDPAAPVDCFYVYPTASADTTPNSDMVPGPEERGTVSRQLARFASACRIFAPVYRQITIPALRAMTAGQSVAVDRELAYGDVVAAWRHYLAHDNGGRGVILYGHSQGAGVLKRLLQEEIEGKPAAKRMVAAYLIGTNVLVPAGRTVGGDFKSTPLCRSRTQTGCVVTYVSFRQSAPPPANSRFGRTTQPGMRVACTNPAALGGGGPVTLHPVFGASAMHPTAAPPKPWVTPMRPITTRYVRVPGLVSGGCVDGDAGGYLAWRVNADPADPRTDELTGDHLDAEGRVQPDWGTHSLDVPVAMGDLIALAETQGRAWARGAK
ncbi:MAG: DUF3089 domain-containing protein [Phenylobacterium sp.]|uniref:DUF3089 domain-containing protein n=1 Tax=Phenylobacterium sp. TaxID=1871053 RepID=UPI001A506BDA|nr:DUF3089 domain-containing protein [Phenylobacterium sp.]MBL8772531.1 DUF3089 domain-containing protein [Phenylobacterium sp.]